MRRQPTLPLPPLHPTRTHPPGKSPGASPAVSPVAVRDAPREPASPAHRASLPPRRPAQTQSNSPPRHPPRHPRAAAASPPRRSRHPMRRARRAHRARRARHRLCRTQGGRRMPHRRRISPASPAPAGADGAMSRWWSALRTPSSGMPRFCGMRAVPCTCGAWVASLLTSPRQSCASSRWAV